MLYFSKRVHNFTSGYVIINTILTFHIYTHTPSRKTTSRSQKWKKPKP